MSKPNIIIPKGPKFNFEQKGEKFNKKFDFYGHYTHPYAPPLRMGNKWGNTTATTRSNVGQSTTMRCDTPAPAGMCQGAPNSLGPRAPSIYL